MICKNSQCHFENHPQAKYCMECGYALQTQMSCPNPLCRIEQLPDDAKFCYSCGTRAAGATRSSQSILLNEYYEKGLICSYQDDINGAIENFFRAALQGHADAQYRFAKLLQDRIIKGTEDPREGDVFKWYRMAAIQDHKDACAELYLCYENGFGIPADKQLSDYWLDKAQELDVDDAVDEIFANWDRK